MEQNKTIMLAVFEKFLENPQAFYAAGGTYSAAEKCFPAKLPDSPDIIRWHVLAFLSEFILCPRIVVSYNNNLRFQGEDYLNWKGKQFYDELKNNAKHSPQEK